MESKYPEPNEELINLRHKVESSFLDLYNSEILDVEGNLKIDVQNAL